MLVQRFKRLSVVIGICCVLLFTNAVSQVEPAELAQPAQDNTLSTLSQFAALRANLKRQINEIENELKTSISESEKKQLQSELLELETELKVARDNFADIAAGMGLAAMTQEDDRTFNLQAEMLSLMEPVVREMKHMTSDVRRPSELRKGIAFYSERVPKVRTATENIARLIERTDAPLLAANQALPEHRLGS